MSSFPTDFAKTILQSCDLYPKVEPYEIADEKEKSFWQNMQFLLREFQSMAVFSSFEDAIHMYSGIMLDDEQKTQLRLVHRLTKEWTKGQIAADLMKAANQDARLAPACHGLLLAHVHGLPGEVQGNNKKTKMLIIKTKERITQ